MISLKSRLLLSSISVLLIAVTIIGYQLDRSFVQKADAHIKIFLESQIFDLQRISSLDSSGNLVVPTELKDHHLMLPKSGYYAAIASDNKIVWRSPSNKGVIVPFKKNLKPQQRVFEKVTASDGSDLFLYSLGYVWFDENGVAKLFSFNVAEKNNNYIKELSSFRHGLFAWLSVIIVCFLIIQAIVLTWGLKPLQTVREELLEIEQGEREFLDGNFVSEISSLTGDFNTLLRYERARQERYKNSLGDLAHSFKTPLAVIKSSVNNEAVDPKVKKVLQEQVTNLSQLVSYQLKRAQAAGARASLAKPVDIAKTVKKISSALLKVHKDKNIEFTANLEPNSLFYGDEGDLLEVLGNLLDNAFKWSKSKVTITSTIKKLNDAKIVEITIDDDGQGIPDDKKQVILQRGVRADQQTPGHGIGMSIITDIINAYCGDFQVGDSPLGGAKFTVVFKH